MGKSKKAILDVLYCIFSVGMMNVVLQFFVYPIINNKMGEEGFGEVLFLVGIMNILTPSFGLGTGNTRLVFPKQDETKNRDYINVLIVFSIVSMLITSVIMKLDHYNTFDIVSFALIIGIAVFRNYAFVEYRISLNYKKQFFFYLVLSVGYVIGSIVFYFTGIWQSVFLLGELFAVLYVICTGSIFNKLSETTEYQKHIMKDSTTLSSSYLLTNGMSNLDKIILTYFVDAVAVSQYYVISLVGKIISIISGPITSVLIGYFAKYGTDKVKQIYKKMVVLICACGIVMFFGCCFITPIFIKLLYPNLYEQVIHFNVIVNAAQILYFLTGIVLTIILTVASSKCQLVLRTVYAVVYITSAFVATLVAGLEGFAIASFISNLFYYIMTISVGFYYSKK